MHGRTLITGCDKPGGQCYNCAKEPRWDMMMLLEPRTAALKDWMARILGLSGQFSAVSGDASCRRYFRLQLADGRSYIGVDAPPDKENNAIFVALAQGFRKGGVAVPLVVDWNAEAGFMLLSDFGDTLLSDMLDRDSVAQHYQQALQQLVGLRSCTRFENYVLPAYDSRLLQREMALLPDWLVENQLARVISSAQRSRLASVFESLCDVALRQVQVTVHRDFHSRNLLLLPDQTLGIIDFQDAVSGPVTYDLVSLVQDCYVKWPQHRMDDWIETYRAEGMGAGLKLPARDEFLYQADLMATQRHLKAAGIFARLKLRDQKPGFMPDVPRTLSYIVDAGERHQALRWLGRWLRDDILPLLADTGYSMNMDTQREVP